jgi:RecB family exonuclease
MRPISPSTLKTFLRCPALYKATHITKEAKFQDSEPLRRGRRVHELLERAVKGPEPDWGGEDAVARNTLKLRRALGMMAGKGARVLTELSAATDGMGATADFFDDRNAYLRCRIDVLVERPGGRPLVLDWKTGREGYDDPSIQLAINCLCLAPIYGLGAYDAALVYVDAGVSRSYRMEVDVAEIRGLDPQLRSRSSMAATLAAAARLAEAHESGDFPRTPGQSCRWCDWRECPSR